MTRLCVVALKDHQDLVYGYVKYVIYLKLCILLNKRLLWPFYSKISLSRPLLGNWGVGGYGLAGLGKAEDYLSFTCHDYLKSNRESSVYIEDLTHLLVPGLTNNPLRLAAIKGMLICELSSRPTIYWSPWRFFCIWLDTLRKKNKIQIFLFFIRWGKKDLRLLGYTAAD